MLRKHIAAAVCLTSLSALAQMTPVGLWKTIDDADGSVKSEVRIVDVGGVVSGKVELQLDPKAKSDDKCVKCSDDRKDKLLLGMEILRGLKKVDGKNTWEDGTVLDPNNGKVYKASLTPIEGGTKLQLRGYIGFFYRTQTWIRAE